MNKARPPAAEMRPQAGREDPRPIKGEIKKSIQAKFRGAGFGDEIALIPVLPLF